jgi:hypothetical protein
MRMLTGRRSTTTNTGFEPRGYLHVSGEFARTHRPEVEMLLHQEEHRAHLASPAARIVGWDDDGSGGLLVTTTTEHLAHRLGRSLKQCLGGETNHGFLHKNKLALVWWRC